MRESKYIRLVALAMLVLGIAVSCLPDEGGSVPAVPDTPEVRFAASTSYLNQLEAKTLYTDDYYISGGGRTDRSSGQVERIDWIAGDKITVFSPQALRYDKDTEPWPLAHKYKVAKMSATTDSVGYSMAHYDVIPADTVLHRHNAGVDTDDWTDALMWNTGESKHSFFAIYPSPQISSVSADHPAISLEKYDEINDVASFTVRGDHLAGDEGIPVNQGVVFDGLNYTYMGAWDTVAANPSAPEPAMRRDYAKYEYLPNMKFVAMAAYKGEQLLSKRDTVGLEFYPVVSALRVELLADPRDEVANGDPDLSDPGNPKPRGKYLKRVILKSEHRTLTGDYMFHIGNGNPRPYGFSLIENEGDEIVIDLEDPRPGKRVKLYTKDTTVFTFIMAPVQQTDLTLILEFDGGHSRSLDLRYWKDPSDKTAGHEAVTLPEAKKAYLSKIPVFKEYEFKVILDHVENDGEGHLIRDNIFPVTGALFDRNAVNGGFSSDSINNGLTVISYRRERVSDPTPKGWYIGGFKINGVYTSLYDDGGNLIPSAQTALAGWISNLSNTSTTPFPLAGYTPGTTSSDAANYPNYTYKNPSDTTTTYYPAGMIANQNHVGFTWPDTLNNLPGHGGRNRENAVDLSYYDVYANNRGKRVTANCYTVHGEGWFKIPLVYGNAIDYIKHDDTGNNTNAYVCQGTPESQRFLNRFLNHAGQPITAPWITHGPAGNAQGGMGISVDGAEILWMDTENLIHNPEIGIGSKYSFDPDAGNYLYFYLGNDITEGNAVIAVKSGGTIVWSWHIWVTNLSASANYLATDTHVPIPKNPTDPDENGTSYTKYGTPGMNTWRNKWRYNFKDSVNKNVVIYNHSEINNDMMNGALGYAPGKAATATPRRIQIRFIQEESGLWQDVDFSQRGAPNGGSVLYYQWGRKDPLLPSRIAANFEMHNASLYKENDHETPSVFDATQSANYYNAPDVADGWSISEAIQNPMRFFTDYKDAYYNSWNNNIYATSQIGKEDDTGLGRSEVAVAKTVYDPCPPGFKVPNEFAFASFNSTGGDIVFTYAAGGQLPDILYFEGAICNGEVATRTTVDDMINVRNANYNGDRGYTFRTRPHIRNSSTSIMRAFGYRDWQTGELKSYTKVSSVSGDAGFKSGEGYYWTAAPRMNISSGETYGGSFEMSFNRVRSVVGSPKMAYTEAPAENDGSSTTKPRHWPTGAEMGYPLGYIPANAFTIRPVADN